MDNIENQYNLIRKISLDNYIAYSSLSFPYKWITEEIYDTIESKINSGYSAKDILESPFLMNEIGVKILNTPYTLNPDGTYTFKPIVLMDSDETSVHIMEIIGDIYSNIIYPILNNKKVKFIYNTNFILYNDRIEIDDYELAKDMNVSHILINVIVTFISQLYNIKNKENQENGQ